MAFAPRRRRRRSRWVIVGLFLSILALLVNVGFSSGSKGPSKRLAQLAYVDQVRPLVESSSVQGADVAEVRGDAVELGRNGIRRKMERVRRGAAASLRGVREVDPPPELADSHSLLVSTMVLRARASSMMAGALVAAGGTEGPDPAVDALVRAAADMVAADQTYRTFTELLVVGGARSPLLPVSVWVADPAVWQRPEVAAFVAALRAGAQSIPVHDVALVTFTTDPKPVASEAGSAVLPVVKALRVEIVVANIGNSAEKAVPVVATLTGPEGQVDTAREFVDLAPGQRRAIALGGLRPALGPSTLYVALGPVEGEGAANDNERAMPILLRG